MDLLDKVIQEWSVKTDKGYPDVNSKEDMDLFESMFGFRLVKEVLAEEYNYAGNCVTGLDDPYFQRNVCYDATEMAGIVDEFSNEFIQADEFVKKVNWPSDQLGPAEDTIYDFAYNKYKDIYWAYHIDDDVHFFFVKDVINEVKNPNSYITVRDITEEGKKTIGVFGSGFRLNEEKREKNQVTVDQLIDLLTSKKASLDSEFISKLYHTVNNKGLKLGTFISNKLEKKGLTGTKNEIFSLINNYPGLEKDLAEFFKDESRQLTISDIRANDSIGSLVVNKTKLPSKFLEELRYAGRASEGGKGVGEGEAFLAVVGKDGKKLKVGDVSIEGKEIEVKGKGGRLIGRNESLNDFYKELEDIDQDIVTSREGASGYVSNIYNKYKNTTSEDIIRRTLNNILNKYFPNSIKADLSSRMSIRRKMLDWYVNSFLDGEAKNVEYIGFFIGSKFKLYSKEEFKNAIINGNIQTQNFTKSNKSPQLIGFSL